MDLLTSSFHSDLGSPKNTDSDQPSDTNAENFKLTPKFIYPDNLIDLQCSLAGRESFLIEGRDSLGVLQNFGNDIIAPEITMDPIEEMSFVQMDIDGRESLGLLMNRSFLENGRDSLWKGCLDIAPVSASSNLLNVGFMKFSTTSSVSSAGSTFRPSLWSFDSDSELSKFFSVNSKENTNSLNTAFIDSNKMNDNSDEKQINVENNTESIEINNIKEIENLEKRNSENMKCPSEKIDEFNDTVFFESIIIANKIENGSILNDLPDDLNSIQPPEFLDVSFDEIEVPFINNMETVFGSLENIFRNEKTEKIETSASRHEEMIKSNKSLETYLVPKETESEINNTEQVVHDENNDFVVLKSESTAENNLLRVQSKENLNTSISPTFSNSRSRNSSNSRSRNVKDLLHNLSAIVATENMENQSEVKQILQDLVNVLLVPDNIEQLNDDSGHSSIEENDVDSDLNFRTDVGTFNLNYKTLQKKENYTEKRLCQSFCFDNSTKNVKNFCGGSNVPNAEENKKIRQRSLEELDSLKKSNVKKLSLHNVKLIPKKIQTVKKGPMKAVVPVANMKRRSFTQPKKNETPSKYSFETSSYLKKRTSTPKMWNTVPVAQSTPEQADIESSSNFEKSLQYSDRNIPSPKLSKSSINKSSKNELLNRSSSASTPNISRDHESPSRIPSIATLVGVPSTSHLIRRRRSVGEIKYTTTNTNVNKANLSQIASVSKISKSPLTRFNKNNCDNENTHTLKRGSFNPTLNVEERNAMTVGSNFIGAANEGTMRSYLSERNKNLLQYIKPSNLLNKMKK